MILDPLKERTLLRIIHGAKEVWSERRADSEQVALCRDVNGSLLRRQPRPP